MAALCEVMSMLIAEEQDMEKQRSFFARHMAPWLARFFADLKAARSASYYRSVARFGEAFTAFEMDFMEIQA